MWACLCFSRVVRTVKKVLRTIAVVINNLYCIPTYVIWMLALRPLRLLLPAFYWKIEGLLFHWLLAQVAAWSWTAGYDIIERGDDVAICMGRRTLILANHQSTGDVPLLMATWNTRPGVLPNLTWIMDHLFKYTNFGAVSVIHGDFFIQSGREKRERSLTLLTQHLREMYIPLGRQFIVLFPEGGFLHKRKPASHRFAEKNNLPLLEYVSLPRAGALKVIMEECGPLRNQVKSKGDLVESSSADSNGPIEQDESMLTQKSNKHASEQESLADQSRSSMAAGTSIDKDSIEWVLDVTIAYEDRVPVHLSNVVYGDRKPCATNIFYRLYKSTEVPTDPEAMTNWLYQRWFEKEKILEEFYRTGKFPECDPSGICRDTNPRRVIQDGPRFVALHIFFISLTFVTIKAFYHTYSLVSSYF